jgi:hypothetical protein
MFLIKGRGSEASKDISFSQHAIEKNNLFEVYDSYLYSRLPNNPQTEGVFRGIPAYRRM